MIYYMLSRFIIHTAQKATQTIIQRRGKDKKKEGKRKKKREKKKERGKKKTGYIQNTRHGKETGNSTKTACDQVSTILAQLMRFG